jgi:hypothetical protein
MSQIVWDKSCGSARCGHADGYRSILGRARAAAAWPAADGQCASQSALHNIDISICGASAVDLTPPITIHPQIEDAFRDESVTDRTYDM